MSLAKFSDPHTTANGQSRAWVAPENLHTVWFNTGTLCNIECANCYIESSPRNDRLSYITDADIAPFLKDAYQLGTKLVGFTGGEPFMNPYILPILQKTLFWGFEVLVLTNAMRPMMRPAIQKGIIALKNPKLTIRVSLDHYTPQKHEEERGAGSWHETVNGLRWLVSVGINTHIAGRLKDENEADMRAGYAALFAKENFALDAYDPKILVLFPEMDAKKDVPEVTTSCWKILGVRPEDVMCATSRMVLKRKGEKPSVVPCTLLPYEEEFCMGNTLKQSLKPVSLNHPHCARFCVLGGASCSA